MWSIVRAVKSALVCGANYMLMKAGIRTREAAIEAVRSHIVSEQPLVAKMLQCFATRTDALPCDVRATMSELCSRAPYSDEDIDHAALDRVRQRGGSDIFIASTPMNSGLVGLVFPGTYKGQGIVVKVLRVNIVESLERAEADLRNLAWIMSWIPGMPIDLRSHVDYNAPLLLQQRNLALEIRDTDRFANNFADTPWLSAPRVHHELSDEGVLVMERLCGVLPRDLHTCRRREGGELLARALLKMWIIDAEYHADLHSGNMLFGVNEHGDLQLRVIDFGLIGELSGDDHAAVTQIMHALSESARDKRALGVARALVEKATTFEQGCSREESEGLISEIQYILSSTEIGFFTMQNQMEITNTVRARGGVLSDHMIQCLGAIGISLASLVELMDNDLDGATNLLRRVASQVFSSPILQEITENGSLL